MSRPSALGACVAAVVLSSCVTASTQWTAAALDVRCNTEGVVILVDDRPMGYANGAPIALANHRGVVRVELRRESFVSRRFDIAVQSGRLHVLTADLWPSVPELDGETALDGTVR